MSYLSRLSSIEERFSKIRSSATGNVSLGELANRFLLQFKAIVGLQTTPPTHTPFDLLTKRALPMALHQTQKDLWNCLARFIAVPAGRRSGKTEWAKRLLVDKAIREAKYDDAWFIAAAPTLQQAKRIFWRDLIALSPPKLVTNIVRSGEPTITYYNGAEITVMGMEVPERAEGRPLSGIVLDEYGNMHEHVWPNHVRPALTDRKGWAAFTGVPEGRNHYYELCQDAKLDVTGLWAMFTWTTEQVLPLYLGAEEAAIELASARASMDDLTYAQEYLASFVTFEGLAYYAFGDHNISQTRLPYRPESDLTISFDFNVAPGVAVISQDVSKDMTHAIGEVYIPKNSNTPRVCNKIIADWGKHKGRVLCFGDATGGSGGSAKVDGSDWALIKQYLRPVFGDRLRFRVDASNPPERVRVNAVNSRCKSADGTVRLLVDKAKCPMLIKDFEGVRVIEGSSGDLDKKTDPKLTHLTDGFGYFLEKNHPVQTGYASTRNEQVI